MRWRGCTKPFRVIFPCIAVFFHFLLLFVIDSAIINLPNKLNIQRMGVFCFLGITIPFFDYTLFIEFDKMQIPYRESCNIPALYTVCLATTGICVFVR